MAEEKGMVHTDLMKAAWRHSWKAKPQVSKLNMSGSCNTIHVAHSICLLGQIYRAGAVFALNCNLRSGFLEKQSS